VINELNLRGHRDFQPKDPSGFNLKAFIKGLLPAKDEALQASLVSAEEREQARQLNVFNSKLTISPVRNTNLAHVIFESTDPQTAAAVANALANAYIESYLEQRLSSTQQASAWMTERLTDLKSTLDQSEQRLQAFLEREGLVDIQGAAATL